MLYWPFHFDALLTLDWLRCHSFRRPMNSISYNMSFPIINHRSLCSKRISRLLRRIITENATQQASTKQCRTIKDITHHEWFGRRLLILQPVKAWWLLLLLLLCMQRRRNMDRSSKRIRRLIVGWVAKQQWRLEEKGRLLYSCRNRQGRCLPLSQRDTPQQSRCIRGASTKPRRRHHHSWRRRRS